MIGRISITKRAWLASVSLVSLLAAPTHAVELNLSDVPLFLSKQQPPLNLLVMGRDHKLYYEAYNDASDLNDDGILDVGYRPAITYFGYFDSNKCYSYSSGKFVPSGTTTSKKCAGNWSGDFLNYLTTSRIDAMRKVLYGGYRSTDTTTETVLERSHIPQDAHSWGKEYQSVAHDGYDISEYAPLSLPASGTRHLFANTTLLNGTGDPLLRVLTDSSYRIWEWVSIERPVAGDRCLHGGTGPTCTSAGSTGWEIVPASYFTNLTQTTYDLRKGVPGGDDTSGDSVNVAHPTSHAEFDVMVADYAIAAYEIGSGSASNINGSGNPFGNNYDYLNIFTGQIDVPTTGTYSFAVDGDDAVEVIIDGTVVAGYYGGHGNCNCQTYSGNIFLTAGSHTVEFRHEENFGGDSYALYWQRTVPASTRTDYVVRVQVCNAGVGLENNCRTYGDDAAPVYKPAGLLQEYGEDERMMFGLLTGSYAKNTSGGVLRKAVSSFKDEVDPDTGIFTSTVGIVKSIDALRTVGFGGNYEYNCGWITTRPIAEGECPMWGNPIAEMMYEGLRYFAGKGSPTGAFDIATSGNHDANLGLPLATWEDPYADGNFKWCAKPFETVISDINPSYDTDQIPGSYFGGIASDISGLNATGIGATIWNQEFGASKNIFVGQSATNYDGAPTAKSVTSFGNIRGLSPEEPTKLGGYYSASVAYHGLTNDINPVDGGDKDDGQKMSTFAVALASPLPRIEIPINGNTVTLVPFAKSVGGCLGVVGTQGVFQPTNQIVDFYVETIKNTDLTNIDLSINGGLPYGKFRINYEDVEQGADHDMDVIVEYEIAAKVDGTLTVTLNSTYAAGCIDQHMGYVISGTTADGIYLEVPDIGGGTNDYFLDTPPGQGPGGVWNDGQALPLTTTRTFTPQSGANTAELLKNPLWYAAKWGGFIEDEDGVVNQLPDLQEEWDADQNGDPDNYFLVTNALKLKEQLGNAFENIVARVASASSASVNSGSINSGTRVYQAKFNSAQWSGQLLSFPVNADGSLAPAEWDAGENMPEAASRNIITINETGSGIPFQWVITNLSVAQQLALNTDIDGNVDGLGEMRVNYLRGDATNEKRNGGTFRDRYVLEGSNQVPKRLGDMIHSTPVFVGKPAFFYPDVWEDAGAPENGGETYSQYRARKDGRPEMVYAGANDGMLHGFDALTGVERIAYVPGKVFSNLSDLTSVRYAHRYYVDGSPTIGDAFYSGMWHTLLVGGLNHGGQAVYALDVTHSELGVFSEANAVNLARWEFTDADDADLGYTYSQPNIIRMKNGRWAAAFGNGYNSVAADGHSGSGSAVLFLVDIETGNLIRKIDTGAGSNAIPNGLATVAPIDLDADDIIDYIYGGDLLGNLWKFDVTSTDPASWDVAYSNAGSPAPLYVAKDANGNVQPITSRPEVGRGPNNAGLFVYFGTGQYLTSADKDVDLTNPRPQTFYGIVDKDKDANDPVADRTELLQQSIIYEGSENFTDAESGNTLTFDIRVTSAETFDKDTHRGWFIDLVSPINGYEGEKQVSNSVLRNGRILFATLIPSGDPCKFGGDGWLMGLDAKTGSRLAEPLFDVSGDDEFTDAEDTVTITVNGEQVEVPISGKGSEVGIIPTPGLLSNFEITHAFEAGTSGDIEESTLRFGDADFGRQSWHQLR